MSQTSLQAAPIGVFDSGVGGLTVLRALRASLPHENFVYLGDTARLPYGTKTPQTVVRYALQCAAALVLRGIRCLVVACNTASSSSLRTLRERYPDLPVIGVIGTEGTIEGGAYEAAIRRLNPAAIVISRACSLFVAMAEEGFTDGPIAEAVAHRYLDTLFDGSEAPDTLVLGCTHFPALAAPIRAVVPQHVRVVDSAGTTAAAVVRKLGEQKRAASQERTVSQYGAALAERGSVSLLATDGAARFARVGGRFLGEAITAETVQIIDL